MNCEEENHPGGPSEIDKEKWERKQQDLAENVSKLNKDFSLDNLLLVGGLDISYSKENKIDACVSLVVMQLTPPTKKKKMHLQTMYTNCVMVKMKHPYVSSFLGFREVKFFEEALEILRSKEPLFIPQIILVDGNGILHVRKCGSASHFGVVCNIPTIGVAKNLVTIPEMGIERDERHKEKISNLKKLGGKFPIITDLEEVLGMAVLTGTKAKNPVYVSIGHNCDLDTAVEVVRMCSPEFRVPEPIRKADALSKDELKKFSSKSANETDNCS